MQSELDYMWNEVIRRRAEEEVLIERCRMKRYERDLARKAWKEEFTVRPCSDLEQERWESYQTGIAVAAGAVRELDNAAKRVDEALARHELFRSTGLVAA